VTNGGEAATMPVMSEHEAILFCNEAFYRAIADRDIPAMEDVWARTPPVSCIHPGWAALFGRDEVLASWRRILSHDEAPKIVCRQPEVLVYGEVGAVICYEDIEGQLLVTTNLFRREGRQWRLVHHQAGPTAAQLAPEDDDTGPAPKPN
jgi:ketosteroid isomerase-like protein